MARPMKSGLDYFPLDVDIFSDDKMEYVTARFDEKGELISVKLLCMIYKNGFYTDWNEDKATIFAKRAGRNISPSLAKDVVGELVKRDFFDKNIFNSFGILTSRGIQRRFLKAITDRKEVEIISDYWLLDLPVDTQRVTFSIIHRGNEINHKGNEEKREVNTQTKLKETKENKTKEKEILKEKSDEDETLPNVGQAKPVYSNKFERVIEQWNLLGLSEIKQITGNREILLNARIKQYGIDDVLSAIKNINKSSFLRGQNTKNWIITFDWFIRPNNFPKVLERNYEEKPTDVKQPFQKAQSSGNPFFDMLEQEGVKLP